MSFYIYAGNLGELSYTKYFQTLYLYCDKGLYINKTNIFMYRNCMELWTNVTKTKTILSPSIVKAITLADQIDLNIFIKIK